jgi:hypothetical protein
LATYGTAIGIEDERRVTELQVARTTIGSTPFKAASDSVHVFESMNLPDRWSRLDAFEGFGLSARRDQRCTPCGKSSVQE